MNGAVESTDEVKMFFYSASA